MIPVEHLRRFLSDAVASRSRLAALPHPRCRQMTEWVDYLGRTLNLASIPANADKAPWRNYPLCLARHKDAGLILIKQTPSIFRDDNCVCLVLDNGRHLVGMPKPGTVDELRILTEGFTIEGRPTARSIGDFIHWPVRSLKRQSLLFESMSALVGSLLFIINFTILAYVVPSQSIDAFRAMSWLVAASAVTLFFSHLLHQRAQLYLDSIAGEREEILKLSLAWSLRPLFIQACGPMRAHQLCAGLARAGSADARASMTAIASLVLLPVLVIMFLRMPAFMFVTTLGVAMIGVVPQVLIQLRHYRRERSLQADEADTVTLLYRITAHVPRLTFYNHIQREIERWYRRHIGEVEARYAIARLGSAGQEAEAFVAGIAQVLGVLCLTILVSQAAKAGQAIPVSTAFIMLHLVITINGIVPKAALAAIQMCQSRIDLEQAAELLNEMAETEGISSAKVTSATVRVACNHMRLPHNCRPKDGEDLNLLLEGPRVVQIAGDSGSGKTTFLNCLLGLSAPEAGTIKVFGVDPTTLSASERARIFSYAGQDIQLLPGTLRDNLSLSSARAGGQRDLWNALQNVELLETVRRWPLGLETPVSEAGQNFSTGERQRLVLAQTILKKSAILVLDEAMSGLPAEMEKRIFRNIRPMFEQIYFVSHREHMRVFAESTIELAKRQ